MEFIKNRENIWLYSASYNNLWWCFDGQNSSKLDMIYDDYKERNRNKDYEDIANVGVIDELITTESKEIINPSFGEVSYDEDNIKNITKKEDNNNFNYTVNIDNLSFYIDFDHWQQVNCVNNRKRRIKLLQFPDNLQKEEYINYSINNGVKGISGKLFNNL